MSLNRNSNFLHTFCECLSFYSTSFFYPALYAYPVVDSLKSFILDFYYSRKFPNSWIFLRFRLVIGLCMQMCEFLKKRLIDSRIPFFSTRSFQTTNKCEDRINWKPPPSFSSHFLHNFMCDARHFLEISSCFILSFRIIHRFLSNISDYLKFLKTSQSHIFR